MCHVQGVNFEQFLHRGLGHDVGTLLFSASDVLTLNAHAERCIGRGAHLVNWGRKGSEQQSDLDATAEVYGCHLQVALFCS